MIVAVVFVIVIFVFMSSLKQDIHRNSREVREKVLEGIPEIVDKVLLDRIPDIVDKINTCNYIEYMEDPLYQPFYLTGLQLVGEGI